MAESSPERSIQPPSAVPAARAWFEMALAYAPSILKLLATLGLFKTLTVRRSAARRKFQRSADPKADDSDRTL
jgi:hypothetical protein